MRVPGFILAALAIVPAMAPAAPARAGAIRVMPVRVEVEAGRRFCALTLGNDGDAPVTVQVRGFAWTRDEAGEDLLDPQAGPIVNPAMATIAPGGSRLVRCSLPAPASGEAEGQWRLLIDELPDPATARPGVIRTLLRISIPVFRAGKAAAARLSWSARSQPDAAGRGESHVLRIANPGTRHAKVIGLTLAGPRGETVAVERSFYLLAGGAVALPLAQIPPGGIASVRVRTDEGILDAAPAPAPAPILARR